MPSQDKSEPNPITGVREPDDSNNSTTPNSHQICLDQSSQSPEECKDCSLHGILMCQFTRRETIEFVLLNTVYRVTALIIFL
ncbi:MAG: hypothetical protein ACTSVZ_10150 [Promethearchaeota archaeon]